MRTRRAPSSATATWDSLSGRAALAVQVGQPERARGPKADGARASLHASGMGLGGGAEDGHFLQLSEKLEPQAHCIRGEAECYMSQVLSLTSGGSKKSRGKQAFDERL